MLVYFTAAFVMAFGPTLQTVEYLDDLGVFMNKQNGVSVKHLQKKVNFFAQDYPKDLLITFEVRRLELGMEYPSFENIPSYI